MNIAVWVACSRKGAGSVLARIMAKTACRWALSPRPKLTGFDLDIHPRVSTELEICRVGAERLNSKACLISGITSRRVTS